jgi:hypothetical protein
MVEGSKALFIKNVKPKSREIKLPPRRMLQSAIGAGSVDWCSVGKGYQKGKKEKKT